MTRRPRWPAVAGVLLVAAMAAAPARADLLYLWNGGTIACDTIEERGANLVLHQGRGDIVVPRGDVARIEKSASPVAPAPGTAPAPAPAPASPTAGGADYPATAVSPEEAGEKAPPPGPPPGQPLPEFGLTQPQGSKLTE